MKKVDMMNQVGISSSTVAKMTNGELVSLKVLEKICEKLDCDFGDIVHYEGKPQGGCIHEQVAKADCECPLYKFGKIQKNHFKYSDQRLFNIFCFANRNKCIYVLLNKK